MTNMKIHLYKIEINKVDIVDMVSFMAMRCSLVLTFLVAKLDN